CRGGCRAEAQARVQEVLLPRRRPRAAPRPLERAAARRGARARAPAVQPRPEAQADGPDQEAAQGEAGGAPQREARPRQDAPARHGRRARDDWLRRRHILRQGVQPDRGQARDGGALLGGVLDHIQAGQARQARYRCYTLLPLHPAQV
ncbi:hypothetical protein KEM52_001584, partial [Ascosphaera acerosa]